jgi:hypothetical protein
MDAVLREVAFQLKRIADLLEARLPVSRAVRAAGGGSGAAAASAVQKANQTADRFFKINPHYLTVGMWTLDVLDLCADDMAMFKKLIAEVMSTFDRDHAPNVKVF